MAGMSFLQSREWETFQRAVGRGVWRRNGVLFIRHDVPFGLNYLYCPRMESRSMNGGSTAIFFTEVKKIAEQEKSMFLKIDPADPLAYIPSHSLITRPLQPGKTVMVDLGKSEDDLRTAMHEKTRYNIRLAERKGVSIRHHVSSIKGADYLFWDLLAGTAARDGFRTHSRVYYEKLIEIHSEDFSNELFFAEYQGEILAAAMINFYAPSGTATYLHGASGASHRGVMAPHLLHWRIIQEAKRRGLRQYDFWGIDEKRWPGVTRFKLGFGGYVAAYPASVELPYRPWHYRAYCLKRRMSSQ